MQALFEPSQAYDRKSFSFVTSSATERILYDAPTCVTQGAPLIYTRVGQPSARILRLMRTPNAPVVTRQRTPSAQPYRAHGDVQQGTVWLTQRCTLHIEVASAHAIKQAKQVFASVITNLSSLLVAGRPISSRAPALTGDERYEQAVS